VSVIFINQSAVHYESLGRGRPVVFLHSWIGTWRYWVPAMQTTSVSHSSYALDLLGFGDTARDPAGYSLEGQARMVQGFLDGMGIERIALVGHGLGALTGLLLAGREPGRVDRILSVAMPLDPRTVDRKLQSASPGELLAFLGGSAARAEELRTASPGADPLAAGVPLVADQINAALAAVREAAISCLLIYGANDPLLRPPSSETAASMGDNVHQVVLDESGHFPMLDAADTFNRLLVDFLALDSGTSPRGIQPKAEWRRRMR
jgi:pimeloyl-ACP methyl ester carboxylesterase